MIPVISRYSRRRNAASVAGGNSATYIGKDTTTQGNWVGTYGTAGYSIVDVGGAFPSAYHSMPGYVTNFDFNFSPFTYVWNAAVLATDDEGDGFAPPSGFNRAIRKPGSLVTDPRIASTFYNNCQFNLSISGVHPVSIYFLDWDGYTRYVEVDVIDADTLTVLDTQYLEPGGVSFEYHLGVYHRWNLSGNITVKTALAGGAPNDVANAFFFD
jgi:hypothetical protein